MTQRSTQSTDRERRIAAQAETERMRILHRDILGQADAHLGALTEVEAAKEVARFSTALWGAPNMDGYFDRQHLVNLRAHLHEAQHGFVTLASAGVLEIVSIPSLPDQAMGFHIFIVFDPRDDADHGHVIGYAVWSLEKGKAPFGQADKVRMAFDIFPDYRDGRYSKVPFTNHEIYNISRRILYHFKPREFRVDATTQISQSRTGNPLKRTAYYLKRGYYPPDCRAQADACLVRLARGQHLGERTLRNVVRSSKATFWIFPVHRYLKRTRRESQNSATQNHKSNTEESMDKGPHSR